MKKKVFSTALLCLFSGISIFAQEFELIAEHDISVVQTEKKVVATAIDMFKSDLIKVAGKELSNTHQSKIVVGTLGVNPEIDNLVKKRKITVKDIAEEWEAFKIINIGSETLVVVGSDARGTAYGVLELSRMIGVSPWEWWADVTPAKIQSRKLPKGIVAAQQPSVEYRGIFLNDEDWGLAPWSSTHFEPIGIKNSIGPKTYSKIFELLLRLRANTIWPAMHEETTPFYTIKGNKEAADKYGIVVGTSHCEPMMRNNAGEWYKANIGRFNFLNNKDNIVNYWSERLKQVAGTDVFMTVGMRGVHDGRMEGVSGTREYRKALHNVFETQKELLKKYINPDVEKIPQAMVLYKEVLSVYKDSLQVPDYVTLMWADDNYGYITNLSDSQEQKRKGGSGIYYHISYWGSPHDYLWLCSTPPAQIYTQMKRAWDNGARKLWILNVGDIKPAEYDTEFFMDLAWDINTVNHTNLPDHLHRWAAREFGSENATEITSIMNDYYRLACIRRPEHMGFNRVEVSGYPLGGLMPVSTPDFTKSEATERLAQYDNIEKRAIALSRNIALEQRDAYFQLVEYPVRGASLMNKKFMLTGQKAVDAYREIVKITEQYNKKIANGKWNLMMSMKPRNLPVFNPPVHTHTDTPLFKADPDYCSVISGGQFTKNNLSNGITIKGLGHSYEATNIKKGSSLHYKFRTPATNANYSIVLGFVPMHPAADSDLRVEVLLDGKSMGIHSIKVQPFTNPWRENVLRNQALVTLLSEGLNGGEHSLTLKALDSDLIIDNIKISSK